MKLAEWPTKDQAAKRIGISVKTLERMADAGKIEQRMRPRAVGTPQAVFNPADVERIASQRAAATGEAYVMPAGTDTPTASESALATITGSTAIAPASFLQQLGEAIAAAVKSDARGKLRVTMTEAIDLGFTRDNLRELVRDGKLENVGTPHRYRFRRRDLEAL